MTRKTLTKNGPVWREQINLQPVPVYWNFSEMDGPENRRDYHLTGHVSLPKSAAEGLKGKVLARPFYI